MLKSVAAGAALALVATAVAAAEDWTTVERTVQVARPAAIVWAQFGGYCDFGKVRNMACVYTKGTGGLGAVRRLNNAIEEVKVGEGLYSYAYYQTVGNRTALRYHGNFSVLPSADNRSSRIVYTLIYDQASLSAADQATTRAQMETMFQQTIDAMKAQAEAK